MGRQSIKLTWRLVSFAVLILATLNGVRPAFDFDLNEPAPVDDELAQVETELPVYANQKQDANLVHETRRQAEMQTSIGCWLSRKASKVAARSLPKYFDFSSFMGSFKRAYRVTEAHFRRSLFLKKCLEVFRARVSFRKGSSSYLRTVNKFSDRTPEEFNKVYMVAPPVEKYLASGVEEQSFDLNYYVENVKQAEIQRDKEEQKSKLVEVESRSTLHGGLSDDECDLEQEQQNKASAEIDQFYEHSVYELKDPDLAQAIREELRDAAIELESRSTASGDGPQTNLPWPGRLKSTNEQQVDKTMIEAQLDWSQHECFHEIYDQGQECGKCYVMATTALAEFYKCTESGPGKPVKKRQFSKDYVLNCAPKYSPTIMGCAGGSMLNTLRFISQAGIYNIKAWRQRRQDALAAIKKGLGVWENSPLMDLKCPLETSESPFEKWGPIKVKLNPRVMKNNTADDWLEALQDGPLVVSVQMPPHGVDSYAEGVHDGEGCATSGHWHAMILVGYGRDEHGRPYWRFRNSWGRDWGFEGHFHLSAEVPSACFGGAVRVYREPLEEDGA